LSEGFQLNAFTSDYCKLKISLGNEATMQQLPDIS